MINLPFRPIWFRRATVDMAAGARQRVGDPIVQYLSKAVISVLRQNWERGVAVRLLQRYYNTCVRPILYAAVVFADLDRNWFLCHSVLSKFTLSIQFTGAASVEWVWRVERIFQVFAV